MEKSKPILVCFEVSHCNSGFPACVLGILPGAREVPLDGYKLTLTMLAYELRPVGRFPVSP